MITKIFVRDRYVNINPDSAPPGVRELNSFLSYNNAPRCFFKAQGGWYKTQIDNGEPKLLYVNRVLYAMSYKDWLEVALNKNFTANIK